MTDSLEHPPEALAAILDAIAKFHQAHDGKVFLHAALGAFNENGDVVDDVMLCYGEKEVIEISLDDFVKKTRAEADFINWQVSLTPTT